MNDKEKTSRKDNIIRMRDIEDKYKIAVELIRDIRNEQYKLMREVAIEKQLKQRAETNIDYTLYNIESDYNVFKTIMKEVL